MADLAMALEIRREVDRGVGSGFGCRKKPAIRYSKLSGTSFNAFAMRCASFE
jgi:hypothetical protein